MIILNGPTGSGKSTTLQKLEDMGYRTIPTYTTRPPRDTDGKDTICLSETDYLHLITNGDLLTTFTAHTVHGPWYYGLLRKDFKKHTVNTVVIGNYFFMPAMLQYLMTKIDDIGFSVFLQVEPKSILKHRRGKLTDEDSIDRLARDGWKCAELMEQADYVIDNSKFKLTPNEIANMIKVHYMEELIKKGVRFP